MPEFKVSVERKMYVTGIVSVTAKDSDAAIKLVRNRIAKGILKADTVNWDEPQYEDDSFDATGDVD